jgi:predicted transcriptional regulator
MVSSRTRKGILMDFEKLSRLGSLLSKEYSREFLRLLVAYRDISASEAASRLELHIKTAQDFLEGLLSLGIVSKREVHESKRPYFRYSLERGMISIEFDLASLREEGRDLSLDHRFRERKDSGAIFKPSARGERIAAVTYFTGRGRNRKERTLSLTGPQGSFLYHLPFPTEAPVSAADIMRRAGIEESCAPEILDLLDLLERHGIIERERPA